MRPHRPDAGWSGQLDRALGHVDRLDGRRDGLAVLVALAALLRQEAAAAHLEVDDDGVAAHAGEGAGHRAAHLERRERQTALAEPHLLLLAVDVDDDERHLVVTLHGRQLGVAHLAGLAVDLADVQEAHGLAQVHEGADLLGADDVALDHGTDVQAREERGLLVGDHREAEATSGCVDLDDAHRQLLLVLQRRQEGLASLHVGAGHLADVEQTEAQLAHDQVDAELLLELDGGLDLVAFLDAREERLLRRSRLGRLDDRRLHRLWLDRRNRLDLDRRGGRDDSHGGRRVDDLDTRLLLLDRLGARPAAAGLELDAGAPRRGEAGDRVLQFVTRVGRLALGRRALDGLDDLGGGGSVGLLAHDGGAVLGGLGDLGDGDARLGAGRVDDGDGELGALGEVAERGAAHLRQIR